ncbi:hypothetical protein THAOC_25550, partial [Thalassiosira oceanica]
MTRSRIRDDSLSQPQDLAPASAMTRSRIRDDSLSQPQDLAPAPAMTRSRTRDDSLSQSRRLALASAMTRSRIRGSRVRFFSGDLEKKKFCLRPEETVSDWHISHDHLGHAKA